MQGSKSHRERKNGRAHELYLEANKARNAKRGKQVFVPGVGFTRDLQDREAPAPDVDKLITNWRSYPRVHTVTVKQTL